MNISIAVNYAGLKLTGSPLDFSKFEGLPNSFVDSFSNIEHIAFNYGNLLVEGKGTWIVAITKSNIKEFHEWLKSEFGILYLNLVNKIK